MTLPFSTVAVEDGYKGDKGANSDQIASVIKDR